MQQISPVCSHTIPAGESDRVIGGFMDWLVDNGDSDLGEVLFEGTERNSASLLVQMHVAPLKRDSAPGSRPNGAAARYFAPLPDSPCLCLDGLPACPHCKDRR